MGTDPDRHSQNPQNARPSHLGKKRDPFLQILGKVEEGQPHRQHQRDQIQLTDAPHKHVVLSPRILQHHQGKDVQQQADRSGKQQNRIQPVGFCLLCWLQGLQQIDHQ